MESLLLINSKFNEKVKFIKSLNDKKYRIKNNAFYLEGIKVTKEILNLKKAIDIEFIAYSSEILSKTKSGINLLNNLKNDKELEKIIKYDFSENVFKYMVDTVSPQGVLSVIKIKEKNIDNLINNAYNNNQNILILDKIQDAGNIGTIIRTANAFNLSNIICIEGTVDVYSQKVLRSTMGTILKSNIVYVSEKEIFDLKQKLNEKNVKIVSTSLKAKSYIDELDYTQKYAFVLGNEANGVSDNILNISDKKIKIKMDDDVESLNVSVAAGIILYNQYKKM